MKKLRLAIACSSLCSSRGGSERAATNLAREMGKRGHECMLLSATTSNTKAIPLYGLPERVGHIAWPFGGAHAEIGRLRERLVGWGADAFVSMQSGCEHLYWSMVCMGSGIPFICSERCDPVKYTEQRVWSKAGRMAVLSGADVIHELLPVYVESVPEHLRERVRIIPNAAPKSANMVQRREKNILFLARFDEQKRPLLLLEAFSIIAPNFPDWNLHIWGHGPQEKQIKKFIKRSGLKNRIIFKGECVNVETAYGDAQIYCLPSQYEGFPNSVLEAMSADLAILGVADCAAMRDIVGSRNGVLAEAASAESLAEALARLMADEDLRANLVAGARRTLEEYAPESIYGKWEQLLLEAAETKGRTVMDQFNAEPFASQTTLSAAARREWLYRNFGDAMPFTFAWWKERQKNLTLRIWNIFRQKISNNKGLA